MDLTEVLNSWMLTYMIWLGASRCMLKSAAEVRLTRHNRQVNVSTFALVNTKSHKLIKDLQNIFFFRNTNNIETHIYLLKQWRTHELFKDNDISSIAR